jgi:hypothetical protein
MGQFIPLVDEILDIAEAQLGVYRILLHILGLIRVNNVKIINIKNGAFAVLLLASSVAGAESQYPASDFQPKVVYQDTEYKHQGSSAPAASSASAKPADSQYPASDFQPKVVYSDPSYKHSKAAPSAPSADTTQQNVAESIAAPATEAKKEESNFVYLIGLAVLAFVGVIFFRKQAQPESHAAQGSSRSAVGGATGVAKYLNRKAGTGVSRYLEKHVKSAAASASLTGVAKYMASQKPSSESASSKPASRVEKYLRDRG